MDFEADARKAVKFGELEDNEAFVKMLSKAMDFGFVKGREDIKKACIELCHSGKIKMSDFFPDRLAEEIEKL